jgi:hypothetical protein
MYDNMALVHSPSIVTNGLILALDAANRKSYIGSVQTSLINTNSWTVSSGSVDGYGQNGNTGENTRLYDTDPWGNQSLVWGTFASGDGGADGGWNTNYPAIDPTKLYRFSVWVRRTSSTSGGTFYLGTGAGGGEVRGTSDSATKGNPYWECQGTGVLTQNQWYLVCGHVYPHFTTYTGRHPNTGYFTVAGGTTKVMDVNGCNIGSDLKWDSASSSAVHRTYHYYCGDATTRLQFMAPRIDLCDGNEPSISELLTNGVSTFRNAIDTTKTTILSSPPPTYSSDRTFTFNYDAPNYITVPLATSFNKTEGTMNFWVYPTIYNGGNGYFVNREDATANAVDWFWIGPYSDSFYFRLGNGSDCCSNDLSFGSVSSVIPINTWTNMCFTWKSNVTSAIYKNGNLLTSRSLGNVPNTNPALNGRIGLGHANGPSYFNGKMPIVQIYNRQLTALEVQQNFNSMRGRYGI